MASFNRVSNVAQRQIQIDSVIGGQPMFAGERHHLIPADPGATSSTLMRALTQHSAPSSGYGGNAA
ncbi:MAG: hypothetical protein KJ558_02205 [Gammaproteobacteria bacterium]|nr:hypothetical protein [Gammaproteobacteria bacterium]MBU1653642.1 hypothetical protein [Gammaproteobacteria bacterium]MBU1962754.1 hypothetical protein [Gammaproteobacteria bacterium]